MKFLIETFNFETGKWAFSENTLPAPIGVHPISIYTVNEQKTLKFEKIVFEKSYSLIENRYRNVYSNVGSDYQTPDAPMWISIENEYCMFISSFLFSLLIYFYPYNCYYFYHSDFKTLVQITKPLMHQCGYQ